MTQIAKVAVAAATYAIDKPYDYLVPSGMELSVGCRVTVPFGRGNRTAEGMVLQLRQEVPAKPLKAIRSLLDQESVLSEKEIRLALWMCAGCSPTARRSGRPSAPHWGRISRRCCIR